MATAFAGASLLPLTLGLGVAIFVTFEQLFNSGVGIAAGVSLAALALLLPYGLGFWLREKREQPMQDQPTGDSLKSKIDQMLTEARVIIPGAQALLGFQLIAVLTKPFSELPPFFTYLHCVGLSAVALSVILLMTPAALHRIGFDGEDSPTFFRIGSRFVVAGSVPAVSNVCVRSRVKATPSFSQQPRREPRQVGHPRAHLIDNDERCSSVTGKAGIRS
jgi:hypothetical protein